MGNPTHFNSWTHLVAHKQQERLVLRVKKLFSSVLTLPEALGGRKDEEEYIVHIREGIHVPAAG